MNPMNPNSTIDTVPSRPVRTCVCWIAAGSWSWCRSRGAESGHRPRQLGRERQQQRSGQIGEQDAVCAGRQYRTGRAQDERRLDRRDRDAGRQADARLGAEEACGADRESVGDPAASSPGRWPPSRPTRRYIAFSLNAARTKSTPTAGIVSWLTGLFIG